MATYSTKDDLLIGDIPLAPKYGDGSGMVQAAADEIDAQIGHLYVTPVVVSDVPANRPTTLVLKKINNFLASGRILADQAAGGEDHSNQAYAMSLVKEALDLLKQIVDKRIVLTGATLAVNTDDVSFDAVNIVNEDPESLVESFYTRGRRQFPWLPWTPNTVVRPYNE